MLENTYDMELYDFVHELKLLHDSSEKIQHWIGKDDRSVSPFYPTKFMYSFFMFNTLYDIDWTNSINEKEIVRCENLNEKGKICQLIDFCFNDKGFNQQYAAIFKRDVLRSLKPLKLDQRYETEELIDTLGDIVEDREGCGRIDEQEISKMTNAIKCLLSGIGFNSKNAKDVTCFIYLVRCNIFHGSKTFEMMQGESQQCRLTIYTAFIDSFINMALERLMTAKYKFLGCCNNQQR